MLSHPMFLRSTIHLGLVGEMHMHTGKNTPTLQDGERKKKKRGQRREDAGAEWIPASQRSGPGRGAAGGG